MKSRQRIRAILISSLVTFIWATSWVLIKIGLEDIPALTFAGLRYFVAFLLLTPFLLRKRVQEQIRVFSKRDWIFVILMGVVSYFIAQGSQFISLAYLPATTLSLILNITSILVTFGAILLIKEIPLWTQWLGVVINLAGVLIFFYPEGFQASSIWGWIFALLCLFANTAGTLLGRQMNRGGRVEPITVTMVSMGIGSTLMLITGISWQGLPPLSEKSILIIGVLALVNTAFTFVLWNYSLQVLTAMESSIITGTMMVYIAILSWIFLGEVQDIRGVTGLVLAFLGAVIVNLRFQKHKEVVS